MTGPRDAAADGAPGSPWSATDAAGYILDRLSNERTTAQDELFRAGDAASGSVGPSVAGTRVRASLARSIDTYTDLLRSVFSSFATEVTRAVAVQPPGPDLPIPVTMIGRPGAASGGVVWIHNTSGGFVPAFGLRMTDLWAADGSSLSADLGSIDPVRFEFSKLPRRSAWVSVQVPGDATPGSYYGHLLAQGLPDAAVQLRLIVQ